MEKWVFFPFKMSSKIMICLNYLSWRQISTFILNGRHKNVFMITIPFLWLWHTPDVELQKPHQVSARVRRDSGVLFSSIHGHGCLYHQSWGWQTWKLTHHTTHSKHQTSCSVRGLVSKAQAESSRSGYPMSSSSPHMATHKCTLPFW